MLGRLMYHARQVQAGKRKPFSVALMFDLPIALGCGWIASGICTYFNLVWEAHISAAIVASYLGPYGLDTVFAKWAKTATKMEGADNGTPD